MGTRKPPTPAMQAMYAKKREDTINLIRDAIHAMKGFGEHVTKKNLMERAGVSSGTLSKPYVLEVLEAEGVCQFEGKTNSLRMKTIDREYGELVKETEMMRRRIKKLDERIMDLQRQKDAINKQLANIKAGNAILRGQRQMLMERLESVGVSLGEIRFDQ